MEKISCAIQRINNPAMLLVFACHAAAFFQQKTKIRTRFGEFFLQQFFNA